ncbi:hypothetical protein [Microcella alkaliphila]|nr:hypothetical protein [Microcella alkaliphila]
MIAIHAAVYANSDTSGFCSMAMLVLPSLAFVFVTLMSAIGVLVGSFFPHWAAGVITTIASFIVVLGAQQLEGDLGRLVPTSIFTFYQPFFEPNVQLHLGRVAFFVTLSTMIWFALARDSWRSLAGAAVAAFALVASLGLTWSADSSPVQYRTPAESVCLEENGVEFCTWPESSDALQAGLNAVTSTLGVVGGRFPTPESFVQEGLRPIGEAGVMRFDSRAITDSDLTFAAVRALVPEPGCDIGLSAWFDLIDWVTFQMSPEFATPELESLEARGDRAERQWLMERYALATDACA